MIDTSEPLHEKDLVSATRLDEIAEGDECASWTAVAIAQELVHARQELYVARLEIERLRGVIRERYEERTRGPA